jgi:hypothetical protein
MRHRLPAEDSVRVLSSFPFVNVVGDEGAAALRAPA